VEFGGATLTSDAGLLLPRESRSEEWQLGATIGSHDGVAGSFTSMGPERIRSNSYIVGPTRGFRLDGRSRLTDDSDDAIQSAVMEAVKTALQGAKAMGLSHVALQDVSLLDEETVVVEIVASDGEVEGGRPASPANPDSPEPGMRRPTRFGEGGVDR
jgi:hypothetical protein